MATPKTTTAKPKTTTQKATKASATAKTAKPKTSTTAKTAKPKATKATKVPATAKTTKAKITSTNKVATKPKTPTTKKGEITLNGNKLIRRLRYEFTTLFPYLELELWDTVAATFVRETKISEVGKKNNKDAITASSRMLVKTFKANLEKTFGLKASFFYYEGSEQGADFKGISSVEHADKTLSQLNEYAKSIGAAKINKNDIYYKRFK